MLCESKLKMMKKSKQKSSRKGFHFAADAEAEMAKWVERFCSVCGLKINDEASVDYRYSPQPNSEFASATSVTSNDYSTQPVPEFSNSSNHLPNNLIDSENESFNNTQNQNCLSPSCNSNQIDGKAGEQSSTYIPIFECHTGKPLNSNQIKENTVPRIPSNSQLSEEFYDVPKSIFIKVPPPSKAFQRFNTITHFPKINWSTYPAEASFVADKKRASVRSLDPTLESSSNSKISPPLNHCHKSENRCTTPFNNDYYNEIKPNEEKLHPPPPRPPKPLSWKSRSKSESCSSLPESNTVHLSEITGNRVNESSFCEAFSNAQPINLDDTYDFPKSEPMHSCNMRATISAPPKNSKGSSHSYTNAPPGHRNTKNHFFDYDYRTTLPSPCDDSNNSFDSESCDKSPLTPNSAFNSLTSNVFSDSLTPPAVNRDLKPKRKGSDSDVTSSPTTPTFSSFTSPPALSNISNMPVNQRFRKPSPNRLLNVTPPRIPSRGRQFHHSREASASEDDSNNTSGKLIRRNSSIEDQVLRSVPLHRRSPIDSNGLTYLDLDLESETHSFSPRTPNHNDNMHKSHFQSSKENDSTVDTFNSNMPESNVYKTIDFVKTEAFNKLRIGLEESHRSSQ